MILKLSSEKQYLVLDNQRLVYYLLNKLGVTQKSSEYEDLVSIGTIGLVKAACTFDTSKGIAFSTYASRCINNEIFMHYRNAKKYANDISIDKPIGNYSDVDQLTIGDTIVDPESNFVEKLVSQEEYINLVSIVLNYLSGKRRIAFLYLMGNESERKIADKLNISQSYVSRIKAKVTREIRKIANQQLHYKEVFSMAILEDEYRISFSSKDISNFNKIFATLLKNLTSVKKLPDFTVNCNKERIIIQVPAHPESFSFIAKIIQEIDDFNMSFVSNKTIISADDTDAEKFKTDTKCIPPDALDTDTVVEAEKKAIEGTISEQIVPTLTGVDKFDETAFNSTVQKGSKVKQVRDYMLSMTSFTVKDLKLHFPNFTAGTINNALSLAKSKGLITATSRGKYVVKRN